jgi:plastocyanin
MWRLFSGPRADRPPAPSARTSRKSRTRRPLRVESLEGRALLAMVTVNIQNDFFSPATVAIHPGDTVQWVWIGSDHSTTSVKGSAEVWDSGVHGSGFTFDHTFTQTGTFAYFCTIHGFDNGNGTASGMSGMVVVSGSSAATLQSISVTPANPSVNVGATRQFIATGKFSDGTTNDLSSQVTWASATTSVATISSTGLATGVAPGTSVITASMSGITGTTNLTVNMTQPQGVAPTLTGEHRLFTGKGPRRKLVGFELDFSTGLQQAAAQNLANYHVVQPGRTKRSAPVTIPVRAANYNSGNNSVMLQIGKFNMAKSLTLTATGLVGATGTPAATIVTRL